MPYLECMAECAGSFLDMPYVYSVPEHEHVQTILKQMHENLEEGILFYGKSCSSCVLYIHKFYLLFNFYYDYLYTLK